MNTGPVGSGIPWEPRDIRCSHAERESVTDLLKQAYAEGRLDHEELDARSQLVMTAKTRGDLDSVLFDLAPVQRVAPDRPVPAEPYLRRLLLPALLVAAFALGSILSGGAWIGGGPYPHPHPHAPIFWDRPVPPPAPPAPPAPPVPRFP